MAVLVSEAGGCRYSVFVSASLLLTFITLSAALLRTLHWVRVVAACTEEDSQCLHDLQRWFYTHFVKGLIKVDIEPLELHFSGLCDQLAPAAGELQHNATNEDQSNLASNFQSSDVRSFQLEVTMHHSCPLQEQLTESHLPGSLCFSDSQGLSVQVGVMCDEPQAIGSQRGTPAWISQGRVPVLVGGHLAFIVSYFLGLYTIFHVAKAYKKLELKVSPMLGHVEGA